MKQVRETLDRILPEIIAMSEDIYRHPEHGFKEFGTREQVIYHPENDYTKKLLTVVPKLQGETDGE